jgi:uncharacterized membrane protein YfcA
MENSTLLLLAVVFAGGFVDSIAGGGGLLTLPAYFAFGLPPHAALATNKFSSTLGTFSAVVRYGQAGTMRLRPGLVATVGALVGSAAGAKGALLVSPETVSTLLVVLVPAVLVLFLAKGRLLAAPKERSDLSPRALDLRSLLAGFLIGGYDGFFGPGTGTFLTIAFAMLLGFDLLTASANARLVNLASNLGAVVVFLWSGKVLFPLALWASAAGIAGNLLGSRLAIRRGERIIRPLLVVVMLLLLAEVVRRRLLGS